MRLFNRTITRSLSVIFTISIIIGMFSISSNAATSGITLSGTCHVQDYGDTDGVWDAATGTLTLGTRGQAKRVEAITINLENNTGYLGTLQYRVHVQDIGWQEYKNAGQMAGTSGQAKRLEGIEMNLTGDLAAYFTVEYAVHIQDYGDAQGFVSDGALAGTTGESKRLEEVQVRIVPRWQGTSTSVNYRVHRQDYGWESSWAKDGAESGTVGQSKRLEGIEIHLTGNQYSGGIEYRTHVQNIGWESTWSKNGEMSGTQGLSYRLEGIEIKLTGQISNYYDVYYRVHAQDYGWLGWAKNGEMSGTSGMSKRLEAIQIVLVAKGSAAPGNVAGVTSIMNEPAVVDGVPTSPSTPNETPATPTGNQPSTPTDTPSDPTGNLPSSPAETPVWSYTLENSYNSLGTYDGIEFAEAYTAYTEWYGTEIDRCEYYTDDSSSYYPSDTLSYTQAYFYIYVSGNVDMNALYVKYNGDEGYRDISEPGYTQYFPDPEYPVATANIDYWSIVGKNYSERSVYMDENGFVGRLRFKIDCTVTGTQDFDVYYKGNKLTTLSLECQEGKGTLGIWDVPKEIYNDVIQYKDNMTDMEILKAGCYWIRNHSYYDYTCWGCHQIKSMMQYKGYVGVTLSCSYVVDGKIVNDYDNYYGGCPKNSNENMGGHHISLVFFSPTEYTIVEVQGSTSLARGETDFSTPWTPNSWSWYSPNEGTLYSVYDKVTWLRDYDTVYDLMLGDYGIDIMTFDPYNCDTWYL